MKRRQPYERNPKLYSGEGGEVNREETVSQRMPREEERQWQSLGEKLSEEEEDGKKRWC